MARKLVGIDEKLVWKIRELAARLQQLGQPRSSAPELLDQAVSNFLTCENRKAQKQHTAK